MKADKGITMDICSGCMSHGRRLKVLEDNVKLYLMLLGSRKKIQVHLCWECEARLRGIAIFQYRIKRAQQLLSNADTLSTLNTQVINNYDFVMHEDQEVKCKETSEIKLEVTSDDDKNGDFFYDSDQPIAVFAEYAESKDNIMNVEPVKKEIVSSDKRVKKKFTSLKRQRKKVKLPPEDYTKYVYEVPLKCEDGKEGNIESDNNVSLTCRLCLEQTHKDNVLEHFKSRHRYVFVCQICDHTVGTRAECVQHLQLLHRRLECDRCGKRACSARAMVKHIESHHIPAPCPACPKLFASRARLAAHAARAHASREAAYCVQCDRHFPSRRTFNSHMMYARPHAERPRIPCPDCGKVFAKQYNLRNHRLTVHAPEPTYGCRECGKVLSSKDSLRRHTESIHRGIKPVKSKMCPFCGRTFQTNRILTHHVRTHTGERPHACPRCPAAFAQKHAMTVHVRNVHQRRV